MRTFGERRLRGVGSTDSAKILGVSRWGTPYDVYLEKTGRRQPQEQSIAMWVGTELQDALTRLYSETYGVTAKPVRRQFTLKGRPHIRCHIDALGDDRIVEIKTAMDSRGWGEPPDGEVPVDYWVQVQHQMGVLDIALCDIFVLLNARQIARYTVPRDDEFVGHMFDEDHRFWIEHVLADVPPPIDDSRGATHFLSLKYPRDDGVIKTVTPEQEMVVRNYRAARAAVRDAEKEEARLANKIRDMIGDARGIRGEGFQIRWLTITPKKPPVAHESIARALRKMLEERGCAADELDAVFSLHTGSPADPYRRLEVKFEGEDDTDVTATG